MTKDEALKLALEALETELAVDMTNGAEVGEAAEKMCEAITAIKAALEAKDEPVACLPPTPISENALYTAPPQRTWVGLTPACPKGLTQYECEVEGVDLVCFLEYTPDEEGSRDSYGLLNEPGTSENLELVNAYVKGTDIDIGHLLLQYLVDHITTTALEDFKNDDY
jgi:hypothetical protein